MAILLTIDLKLYPMGDYWIALLRGINVGTAKRVAMADLRAVVEDLGYQDVATLLNSGNVVFRQPRTAKAFARASHRAGAGEAPWGVRRGDRDARDGARRHPARQSAGEAVS